MHYNYGFKRAGRNCYADDALAEERKRKRDQERAENARIVQAIGEVVLNALSRVGYKIMKDEVQ